MHVCNRQMCENQLRLDTKVGRKSPAHTDGRTGGCNISQV